MSKKTVMFLIFLDQLLTVISCIKIALTFVKKEGWNKKLPNHSEIGVNISESYSFLELFKNVGDKKTLPRDELPREEQDAPIGKVIMR